VEKLFKQLDPILLDKQVIKKKRTRWDDKNDKYEYDFEDVYELPSSFRSFKAFEKYHPDAVITLGCVIKGDTDHDKYINHAVSQGITMLSIQYKKPFIFGLLTPNTMKQALERSGGKHGNKGAEVAEACLKMIDLAHKLK
jgi:6,7-dimethyl-8-ribityllumazine synthase